MISLIYARSLNNCIGNKGQIPWHLPDEFRHFEDTTMGKPVIMGRKTYEDNASALPGCLIIVISNQQAYQAADGVALVHSLPEAVELAHDHGEEVFVIGGVGLFIAALPGADTVYESVIDTVIQGDTVLPSFDFSHWQTRLLQHHPIDEQHKFAFKIYQHKRLKTYKELPSSAHR